MKQIDSLRRNVLAELAGRHMKSARSQRIEQLGLNQVNLPKIRRARCFSLVVSMLHRRTAVGIAFDAQSSKKANAGLGMFTESMAIVQMDRHDRGLAVNFGHRPIFACAKSPLISGCHRTYLSGCYTHI